MLMDTLKRDIIDVVRRHGDLSEEEAQQEARELMAVFSRRAGELAEPVQSGSRRIGEILLDLTGTTRRSARIQVTVATVMAVYLLAWTITVTVTHTL